MEAAWNVIVALRLCPLSVAVMSAFALNAPEEAVNVPITWPAGTTTLEGTLRPAVLDDRETVVPAMVEWLRVTEHVVEECAAIVAGLQFSVFSCTPATGS